MDLLFRPDDTSTVRIRSESGSWSVRVKTATEIMCTHGEYYTITVDYRREITHEDSSVVLDAFEAALRAAVAQTEEQKMQASEGVRQLLSVLTDECVFAEFTDPCTIPES